MITLQGPDGASQEEVIAQAQALYKPQAVAAPSAAPAPRPARKPAARPAPPNKFLQQYNDIRNSVAAKITDPELRRVGLQRFDSDPRAQKLRQLAGLAPLSSRQGEVRAVARKSADQVYREAGARAGQNNSRIQSLIAGASKGMFGIPQHMQAALLSVAPTAITGIPKDATYNNILQTIRGRDDASIASNRLTGLAGEIGGGLAGGGPVGGAIKAGGARLAASAMPHVARVGNVLQNLVTLRKGQKLANTGKLVAMGGSAGAAQALGTGGDVVEGTVGGAVAAPLLVGGLKLGQVATRPFRDVLQITGAEKFLRRLTTATRDQLERRAAAYRQATGAEPTLFELLPLVDRNKILKTAVVGKDNVVEQTSDAIRARARNLGPEMSDRARQVLQPNRDAIQNSLRADLARARGGALAAGDDELIANAMENSVDMRRLRQEEARAIMAPYEGTRVVDSIDNLLPDANPVTGAAADAEAANVIRSAAGVLRARAPGAGVTAGDITDMISTLRGDLAQGGIEGRAAERAINHLQNVLDNMAPEAGAAARQMSDAYAARSRMLEGMKEGAQTRLRGDVYPESSSAARKVTNAYDTPEGSSGRVVGQSNRILNDLGGSPEEALRATVKQSRGSTGRQISQNLGAREADEIAAAARMQDESAQALAAASNKAQSGSGDSADAETLVQAIAGLHPSSFITTKAGAMRRLVDMTYIPENRARTMIDMLFSQDPAMMRRALDAIGNEPNGATFAKALSLLVGQASGNSTGGIGISEGIELGSDVPSVEDDLNSLEGEESEIPVPDVGDSPYGEALQNVYATENPDLIELVQRVKQQESGSQHFDENGQPITSSAGAIGIMQVMPGTAPEAAALAGLPWDENAYRTDPAYNELIGIAYLSEQLRKYNGDVERALAAYNAGPGAVDNALSMRDANWLAALPAETQDYVARIG